MTNVLHSFERHFSEACSSFLKMQRSGKGLYCRNRPSCSVRTEDLSGVAHTVQRVIPVEIPPAFSALWWTVRFHANNSEIRFLSPVSHFLCPPKTQAHTSINKVKCIMINLIWLYWMTYCLITLVTTLFVSSTHFQPWFGKAAYK